MSGETLVEIARTYNVSHSTISRLIPTAVVSDSRGIPLLGLR